MDSKLFSGNSTLVITNVEIGKHIDAVVEEFKELDEKLAGFSFWNSPRHFVATEVKHNNDGLHFAWPGTISNVDMVK